MNSSDAVSYVLKSPRLPALPTTAVRLIELSKQPNPRVEDVVEVIKPDPALSAWVLVAVNSAWYGLHVEVTDTEHAVRLLGGSLVCALGLGFSISTATVMPGPMMRYYNAYWRESVVQALAAEELADDRVLEQRSEYFLAGLLTDIGRLAMLWTLPEKYRATIDAAELMHQSTHTVEMGSLSFNHIEVGEKLASEWRLPKRMTRAMHYQHCDSDTLSSTISDPDHDLIRSIAISSCVGDYFCGFNPCESNERLKRLLHDHLDWTEEDMSQYLERVYARVQKAEPVFAFDASSIPSPDELLSEVNSQMMQLSMETALVSAKNLNRTEELETENAELRDQLNEDQLTGLKNRRFLEDALTTELHRCVRSKKPIGILFLDIDHFKAINDEYGHLAGDELLKVVAEMIENSVRKGDYAVRFGGEEFVVLMYEPTFHGVSVLAERLRSQISETETRVTGGTLRVTVSIGACLMIPEGDVPELKTRLLAEADEAMYYAKSFGRDCICLHELDRDATFRKRHCLTDAPIENSEFAPLLDGNDESF